MAGGQPFSGPWLVFYAEGDRTVEFAYPGSGKPLLVGTKLTAGNPGWNGSTVVVTAVFKEPNETPGRVLAELVGSEPLRTDEL
jgi:hypothetical protein